jgi:hypothetical protein
VPMTTGRLEHDAVDEVLVARLVGPGLGDGE